MKVPRAPFYEKELTLKLSRSYGPGRYDPLYEEMAVDYPIGYVRWTEQRNMAEFLRLLAAGRVDVRRLITHRFAVDDASQAYAAVTDPASGSLGVLLEYAQGELERPRIEVGRPAVGEPLQGAVGVGLLGAGNFATATLLPALAADVRFVPRGIYTPSGLSARDVAERSGFAFCAGSPDEVLSDPDTRAVVIAARHAAHAALAAQALRAGKAVFVEKPLAITESRDGRGRGGPARDGWGADRRLQPSLRAARAQDGRGARPALFAGQHRAARQRRSHAPRPTGSSVPRRAAAASSASSATSSISPPVWPARPPCRSSPPAPGLRCRRCSPTTSAWLLTFADGSVATVVYSAAGDTAYPKERIEVFCEGKVMVSDDFKRLSLTQGGRTHTTRASQADKGHRAEMKAFLDLAAGRRAGRSHVRRLRGLNRGHVQGRRVAGKRPAGRRSRGDRWRLSCR